MIITYFEEIRLFIVNDKYILYSIIYLIVYYCINNIFLVGTLLRVGVSVCSNESDVGRSVSGVNVCFCVGVGVIVGVLIEVIIIVFVGFGRALVNGKVEVDIDRSVLVIGIGDAILVCDCSII
jgi:hypothetical protein